MLYDYKCSTCGRETEAINRIEERHSHAPVCCETSMKLVITKAPYGWVDREVRYVCPVTNKGVTNRRQRNEIMARENLVDANDVFPTREKRLEAKAKEQQKIAAIRAEEAKASKEVAGIFAEEQKRFMDSL